MRIAYLSDSTIPSRKANSIQVMQMCQAFANIGHKVTLFARPGLNSDDDFGHYGVQDTFKIVKCSAPGTLRIREWRYAMNVRRALREHDSFDLVYGRHLPSLAAAIPADVPFIYEAHQPASHISHLTEHVIFRKRNLFRIVFISEALRQYYLKRFPWLMKSQTLVRHSGAALPAPLTQPRSSGSSTEKLRVGYSGSLYQGRGIELIGALAAQLTDFDFHICGGDANAVRQCQQSVAGAQSIQFHGFQPPSEVRTWQQSMDILLAPYQQSVPTVDWMSPLKIFEYMASGTPIVASDFPVLREVLVNRETAMFAEPGSIEAWATALNLLKDSDLRKSLAHRAAAQHAEHFTWNSRAANVLADCSVSQQSAAA